MANHETSPGPAVRVLDVADRLFYEQGYRGTGVNQIIAQAGVAKASFYRHFPSKEELAIAYLKKRQHDWFKRLHEAIRAEPDTGKRIFALFDFLEAWLVEVDFRGCAFLNMTSETPELGGRVPALVGEHKARLRACIHRLAALARGGEGREIGDAVHILFEGAIVEAQVTHDLWPVRAARAATIRLMGQ